MNLTRQNENCQIVEQGGINKSVMYKRATNCITLNLTGIVLIEYENRNLDVYCENGWLLIQRRQHGYDINFNRTWIEYKNGFGSLRGEFWIGNEIIYGLTNSRNYRLRIELVDWNENFYVVDYENFRVDSEKNFYQLHIQTESFSGNASRDYIDDLSYGLSAHNNAYFQTYDHSIHLNHTSSNSKSRRRGGSGGGGGGNCALKTGGAWWVLNDTLCLPVNLNGIYVAGASSPQTRGIKWLAMNNHDKNYSLKKSKMKIQPMD
jgi:ficolin